MAKLYRLPDFKKMYPKVSEEVIAVLKTIERKMQYQEYDLKVEKTVIDEETQTVTIIPSCEDSYERLARSICSIYGIGIRDERTGHAPSGNRTAT